MVFIAQLILPILHALMRVYFMSCHASQLCLPGYHPNAMLCPKVHSTTCPCLSPGQAARRCWLLMTASSWSAISNGSPYRSTPQSAHEHKQASGKSLTANPLVLEHQAVPSPVRLIHGLFVLPAPARLVLGLGPAVAAQVMRLDLDRSS